MFLKRILILTSVFTATSCLPSATSLRGPDAMPDAKRPDLHGAPTQEHDCQNPQLDPLLVNWNPSVKDEMKELADSGVLFVRYTSCEEGKDGAATTRMEVVEGCGFGGAYGSFEEASGESGDIKIDNARDLYANLNLSAAQLQASYKDGTTWLLNWAAWSKRTARDRDGANLMQVKRSQLGGKPCAGATHFIRTLWLGAARWDFEAEMSYGAAADVAGAGGGGANNASSVSKRTGEGDYDYCKDTATADRSKVACRALIKVALKPIEEDLSPTGKGAAKPEPHHKESVSPTGKTGVKWIFSKPAGIHFTEAEITVEQFESCVKAGACAERTVKSTTNNPVCNLGHPDRGNHPMNCVNWEGALDFCEWLAEGGRLPTQEEWYAEASNGGRWSWPWGPGPLVNCDLAVWGNAGGKKGCDKESTWPVCSKPKGKSVSGLCDMGGNVWEWTSDWYDKNMQERISHGGSWYSNNADELRTKTKGTMDPGFWYPDHGFRCALER